MIPRAYVVAGMLALVSVGAAFAPASAATTVSVRAEFGDLDPYGEWVYIAGMGDVWRPYADPEWRPFTYGHWVWSSDGWLWVSDEPFGWVVCHYGNWYLDDDWGWVWIPGYDWSPARVEWYVTDYEIGWAPLFPPSLSGRPRAVARAHWSFVPARSFGEVEVHRYVTVRAEPVHRDVKVVVRREAPRVEVVRRVVGRPFAPVTARKVTVTGRPRAITRVEVEASASPRTTTVVPIGPRYRDATVRRRPAVRTEVEARPAVRTEVEVSRPGVRTEVEVQRPVAPGPAVRRVEPASRVTITRESPQVERRTTIEVEPAPAVRRVEPASSETRVEARNSTGVKKVKVKDKDKDDDEDDDNQGSPKRRVIIEKK